MLHRINLVDGSGRRSFDRLHSQLSRSAFVAMNAHFMFSANSIYLHWRSYLLWLSICDAWLAMRACDEVYLKNRQLSNKGEKYTKKLAQLKFRARIAKVVGTDTYLLTDPASNKQYGVYNCRDIFMK